METDLIIQEKYNSYFYSLKEVKCPNVSFYPVIDSTNDRLKIMADEGAKEGFVVVSYCQTNGHGRSGRSFYSPTGGNVYMSILLKPTNPESFVRITPAAAVAVSRAIKKTANIDVKIKWVNDLFYNDKKVCGILASAYGFEKHDPYIVLGIGINVSVDSKTVPDEIKDIYGSLYCEGDKNNMCEDFIPKLAASVYEEYMLIYRDIFQKDFMDEYRQRSNVIGKEVFYQIGEKSIPVKVIDIDDNGAIVLLHEDGQKKTYKDGEIRIKLR